MISFFFLLECSGFKESFYALEGKRVCILVNIYYLSLCSAIPVPTQAAPPPRMVNLCQTTQTTLIAPNPMLQSAILMQQMQGTACNRLYNAVP